MEFDLTKLTPDVRKLNDIKDVVYDKEWLKTAENFDLYYMYRGLEEKNKIRYDITIVPAKMLGCEFVKTKGHYHLGAYGEVYTVLEGQAIYLMQKKSEDDKIEDVYAVKAAKGDVVVIPSFYGHVTINPSETEDLKMANWVAVDCKSDYSLFEKFQGACYFYTKQGVASAESFGESKWLKNENYKSVPELRLKEPQKFVPQDLEFLKQG